MSKDHISATVDPEVADYLDKNTVNASGLINQLVKNHMTGGGDERAMLELRQEQLRDEIDSHKATVDQKEQRLAEVEERLEAYQDETEVVIDEAAEVLADVPLDVDNPAVQRWAEKANVIPEKLVERLQQRR